MQYVSVTGANGHVFKNGISEFCHYRRSRKSNKVEKKCDLSQSVIKYTTHEYLMKVIPETSGAH